MHFLFCSVWKIMNLIRFYLSNGKRRAKELGEKLGKKFIWEEFMPFKEIDVTEEINTRREESADFDKAWIESRNEYKLIGEMIRLRK